MLPTGSSSWGILAGDDGGQCFDARLYTGSEAGQLQYFVQYIEPEATEVFVKSWQKH